jgi:diguanylate cyclase (GGDEF)-like protein/PAS domain S-box-containing protein
MAGKGGDMTRHVLVPVTLFSVAGLSLLFPRLAAVDAVALSAILCLYLSGLVERREPAAEPADPFLEAVLAHSGDVLCVLDRNTTVTYVSPSAPHRLGWSDDTITGSSLLDLVHPVDRAAAGEALAAAIAGPVAGPMAGLDHVGPLSLRLLDGRGGWRQMEMVITDGRGLSGLEGLVLTLRDLDSREPASVASREERDFTEAVMETVGALVVVTERDGRIVRFNGACERATGWRFEEVEGRIFWELFLTAKDASENFSVWQRLTAGEFPFAHENDWVARDGSLRRISWTTTALTDERGQVTYVIATGIDVTETRQATRALAVSERAFRAIADTSTDIITRTSMDGQLLYVSPAITSVLGYRPEELVGTPGPDIIHPDDRGALARAYQASQATAPVHVAFRARHRDGQYVWCETSTRIRPNPDTGELEVQAATRDISERRQAEELYRTLVELCPDPLIVYDEAEIGYANQAAADLFGVARPEDLMGREPLSFTCPEHKEEMARRDRQIMAEGQRFHAFERTCVRQDGETVEVETSAGPLHVRDGTVVMAILRDVTERRRAQAEVAASELRLRTSLDALLDGFAHYEAVRNARGDIRDFQIRYINPAGMEPFGATPEEVIGKTLLGVYASDTDSPLFREMVRVVETGQPKRRQVEFPVNDEELRTFETQAVRMGDGLVLSFRDVTERRAAELRLAHAATHDELTDLPNRAMFLDRLERALAQSRRGQGRVAVLYMDLDRFKVVNDSLGHSAGDELLVAVANRLMRAVRPSDMVARLGGDEFVILTENLAGLEEAQAIGVRIETTLSEPILVGGQLTSLSSSVGITLAGPSTTAGDLLRDADAAMYRAKRLGRGRQEVFDELMRSEAVERLEVEMGLRRALDAGEFRVFYQPQFDLQSGELTGTEALVRWVHPDRGLLGPADFLPVAEETGLVVPLGRFVLEESCRQLSAWLGGDGHTNPNRLVMAVNVSAGELVDPGFADSVLQILAANHLPAGRLCLEVTEQAASIAASTVIDTLRAVREAGVIVAIDDFGTGYSSLSHIRTLPVDIVKLDRMFVQGLGQNSADECVIAAVAQLAAQLGMVVMAEGIETPEQQALCRALGCQLGQGYLLGMPALGSEISLPFAISADKSAD